MSYTDIAFNGSSVYCPNCKKETTFTEHLDVEGGYFEKNVCNSCGWENPARSGLYLWNYIVYKQKCKCGNEVIVTSQEDGSPEYYTTVGVVCSKCRELVLFSLPVN